MKALTFAGQKTLRYESVADAVIEAPGDVIVKTRLAGICGSDLHVYHGREQGLDPGTVMGHELVGEIVEVGSAVEVFKSGDRVCSPFSTNCGRCFYCAEGLTSRCTRGLLFGWVRDGVGLQGVQAEYARVPLADSTLVSLPEDLSDEEGVLLGDVLPTGYFCAEMAGVSPGGVYAVIGCGPVGLMAIAAARHLGAEEIYGIDPVPERVKLARRFGAIPIESSNDDPVESVRQATDGRGADAVLEAVGRPPALRLAIDLVRPGGTIAAAGVLNEEQFSFTPTQAYDKNLTYRTGRCPARRYMERLLPLVRENTFPLASVISHRLPLGEGARGYKIFDRKLEGCTKVGLVP